MAKQSNQMHLDTFIHLVDLYIQAVHAEKKSDSGKAAEIRTRLEGWLKDGIKERNFLIHSFALREKGL